MEFDSFPELSPEHLYAHKLAAKELVKYCEEFARWRTALRDSAGLVNPARMRKFPLPCLNEKPGPLGPRSSA